MNKRLQELYLVASEQFKIVQDQGLPAPYQTRAFAEKFAELIVRMCADYADMAQDADCEYVGDYVAEAMGFGEEEGVAVWRNGV